MSRIECSDECPSCSGSGNIYGETLIGGHKALTIDVMVCPNVKVTTTIQGFTGKRYDVSLEEFRMW